MLNHKKIKSIFLFFLTFCLFLIPLFSAKKNDSKEKQEKVSVKLPQKKRTFFSKIDSDILLDIENGTPYSLKNAINKLNQQKEELKENEKVLIIIATKIMQIVWKSEKIIWDTIEFSNENQYLGAIHSVEQGFFDSSTGNVDFLSTLLPALLCVKTSNLTEDVLNQCESSVNLALKMNSSSILAHFLLGLILEQKKDFVNSEQKIKFAYSNCEFVEEISLTYARILRKNGNLSLASEVLSNIPNSSNDLEILKQNAYISFEAKDFSNAELYVAKVLQQTPNDLEFLLFRVKILVEKQDFIHAVSLLDMYARFETNSIDYLLLRSKVQLDWSKNTTAATETIEKALKLYPENLDALIFAAKIASITDSPVAGKYADELSQMILNKDSQNKDALIFALQGLVQRQNWQEAYSICKKVISDPIYQENLDVINQYIEICINLKKQDESYDFIKKLYDKNPNDEEILQTYIFAFSKVGSKDSVLNFINNNLEKASTKLKSNLYYRRSFLQSTEEKILADLRSSLISNPRNSDALFRLYEVYFGKSDYRKAQYYLRQVVAINPNDSSLKKLNENLTKLLK